MRKACWPFGFLLLVLPLHAVAADVVRCLDAEGNPHYTSVQPEPSWHGCTNVSERLRAREGQIDKREKAVRATLEKYAPSFRRDLKPGDESTDGLIVEVRPKIALVQTGTTAKWLRIDKLLPAQVPGRGEANH